MLQQLVFVLLTSVSPSWTSSGVDVKYDYNRYLFESEFRQSQSNVHERIISLAELDIVKR